MGIARIAVLVVAVLAAGGAALLVRGMVSDESTANANSPAQIVQMPTTEVLVASKNMARGDTVKSGSLRWQAWPENAVSPAYITKTRRGDALSEANNSVVRAPLNAGEPITVGKLVKADDNGFMAAVLQPGMRAISTRISPETGAGGFILPNDRVDVIVTEKVSGDSRTAYRSSTFLENVRVLAIDQTFKEVGDEKVVVGKTATLELRPEQAESLARNKAVGELSLSLRSLSDSGPNAANQESNYRSAGMLRVFRYGAETTVTVGSSK